MNFNRKLRFNLAKCIKGNIQIYITFKKPTNV